MAKHDFEARHGRFETAATLADTGLDALSDIRSFETSESRERGRARDIGVPQASPKARLDKKRPPKQASRPEAKPASVGGKSAQGAAEAPVTTPAAGSAPSAPQPSPPVAKPSLFFTLLKGLGKLLLFLLVGWIPWKRFRLIRWIAYATLALALLGAGLDLFANYFPEQAARMEEKRAARNLARAERARQRALRKEAKRRAEEAELKKVAALPSSRVEFIEFCMTADTDAATLRLLLREHPDWLEADEGRGDTLLHELVAEPTADKALLYLLLPADEGATEQASPLASFVNTKNAEGDSPLHIAAAEKRANPFVLLALRKAGADISLKDGKGRTAWEIARKAGAEAQVLYLLSDG